jgi:hypothetical protein
VPTAFRPSDPRHWRRRKPTSARANFRRRLTYLLASGERRTRPPITLPPVGGTAPSRSHTTGR